MRRHPLLHAILPVLLCFAGGPRPSTSPSAAAESRTATCRFSNPSFSGFCTETVELSADQTPGQACRAILSCLNNTACTKTYCSATTIRGGWKLEEGGR